VSHYSAVKVHPKTRRVPSSGALRERNAHLGVKMSLLFVNFARHVRSRIYIRSRTGSLVSAIETIFPAEKDVLRTSFKILRP
jgi:hypothetical protein